MHEMLSRHLFDRVMWHLKHFSAVAILGCRQIGKTTLAHQIQAALGKPSLYVDLELPEDRVKFSDPQLMLEQHSDKLLILDEIQRVPELFSVMRSIIDRRRQKGDKTGHYLVLGSASQDLLKQSSESLAGRIAYLELAPLGLREVNNTEESLQNLWLRGGFPDSFLAPSEESSMSWRKQFIRTYLERDLPLLGRQYPADRIHRLWSMLAYDQGSVLNASRLATSLEISVASVRSYIELMLGLFLLRFLHPWSGNSKKRLVKSPKVYVIDSGLLHALTGLASMDALMGHSLCGFSWEGFVIQQILQHLSEDIHVSFYRNSSGDEIDLILEYPDGKRTALEIKRTSSPTLTKGFCSACEAIGAHERYYIIPKGDPYPLDDKTRAIGIREFLLHLK